MLFFGQRLMETNSGRKIVARPWPPGRLPQWRWAGRGPSFESASDFSLVRWFAATADRCGIQQTDPVRLWARWGRLTVRLFSSIGFVRSGGSLLLLTIGVVVRRLPPVGKTDALKAFVSIIEHRPLRAL